MRTDARLLVVLAFIVASDRAHAFNALGHKVIAEIAWQRLAPE